MEPRGAKFVTRVQFKNQNLIQGKRGGRRGGGEEVVREEAVEEEEG